METPKSTETQISHLWCTTQDYWSGFTATGPLDGWDQWWQDRCGCCRHRWGDLVQVKRVGMRQNGISIVASGYSVLIRYIMYFFTLGKHKQWYIIHNMLFFLSMFVCMFFFYVPMFYVNLHSLYQYQEDSAVSAEVPNTMHTALTPCQWHHWGQVDTYFEWAVLVE